MTSFCAQDWFSLTVQLQEPKNDPFVFVDSLLCSFVTFSIRSITCDGICTSRPFPINSSDDQYSLFSLRQQARWWRGRVARGQRECREKKESAKEFKLRIIDYPITIYRVDQGDSLMSELTDSFIHCLNSPFSQHQILPFDV